MLERLVLIAGFTIMGVCLIAIAWMTYRVSFLVIDVGNLIIKTH